MPNPPAYGMNTRFLPSMFAPKYHDDRALGNSVRSGLVHVLGPGLRCIAARLDLGEPAAAQRDHQADRPIHLRLRRSGYSARVSLRPCGQ